MRTNTYRTHGGLGTRTETWNRRGEGSPKGRTGRFEGTQFVTVAELNARDAHRRALELEKSKQAGELAVENRRQIGETNRQGMTTGLDRDKFGFDKETSARDFTLKERKMKWDEFSKANGLGVNNEVGYVNNQLTGPQALAGFKHYLNQGNKDYSALAEVVKGMYGGNEKTSTSTTTDKKNTSSDPIKKKKSEPFGSSFMKTNAAHYSGLKGLQTLSDIFINRPLRQSYDWGKQAAEWSLREK